MESSPKPPHDTFSDTEAAGFTIPDAGNTNPGIDESSSGVDTGSDVKEPDQGVVGRGIGNIIKGGEHIKGLVVGAGKISIDALRKRTEQRSERRNTPLAARPRDWTNPRQQKINHAVATHKHAAEATLALGTKKGRDASENSTPLAPPRASTPLQEQAALRANLRHDAINKRHHIAEKWTSLYGSVLKDAGGNGVGEERAAEILGSKKLLSTYLANGNFTSAQKNAIKAGAREFRKSHRSINRLEHRLENSVEGNDLAGKILQVRGGKGVHAENSNTLIAPPNPTTTPGVHVVYDRQSEDNLSTTTPAAFTFESPDASHAPKEVEGPWGKQISPHNVKLLRNHLIEVAVSHGTHKGDAIRTFSKSDIEDLDPDIIATYFGINHDQWKAQLRGEIPKGEEKPVPPRVIAMLNYLIKLSDATLDTITIKPLPLEKDLEESKAAAMTKEDYRRAREAIHEAVEAIYPKYTKYFTETELKAMAARISLSINNRVGELRDAGILAPDEKLPLEDFKQLTRAEQLRVVKAYLDKEVSGEDAPLEVRQSLDKALTLYAGEVGRLNPPTGKHKPAGPRKR